MSLPVRRRLQRMTVTSKDGTVIDFERAGEGPAVILVGGGLVDRSENAPLVPELASRYTVCNYDRRGRGGSGDTPPYALERELEDIEALIAGLGGRAHLYGVSSGGALALEAAAAGLDVDRVAVYEVPYCVRPDMRERWNNYVVELERTLATGRGDDAVSLFMRLVGASDADIAGARQSPFWAASAAIAPTLAYDAACLRDGVPPAAFANITRPVLILTGEPGGDATVGGLPGDFFTAAAARLADVVPRARREQLPGQQHVADPKVVAPRLADFFGK
jgi:pimeloyl-ACP methyl ester carboxylesterase